MEGGDVKKRNLCIVMLLFAVIGCSKKQKVIFEGQSIEYRRGDALWMDEIKKECSGVSESLSEYLEKGWKVTASSPKEKLVYNNKGTCKGTEYIIEK
jgi:hypothetical protein